MQYSEFYKSVLEQDRAAVVICDLNHIIIYMNPAAGKNYEKSGGMNLVGSNLMDCHNPRSCEIIEKVVAWFAADKKNNMIYTSRNDTKNKDVYMVALRDENGNLIGYYEKHEFRNQETASLYDFDNSLV